MGRKASRKRERRVLRQGEAGDIPVTIIPDDDTEGLVCDFCSSTPVRWFYRTKDDSSEETGVGGWAACEVCHTLIEGGRKDSLARRSARVFSNKHPELSGVPLPRLTALFKEYHNQFRAARREAAIPTAEYVRKYGRHTGHFRELLQESGLVTLANNPGANLLARPVASGAPLLHPTEEEGEYKDEGFTAEQLSDPRTVEYILNRIKPDRPAPNIPLTMPITPNIKEWVGARTFVQSCAAVYGETPRADDLFAPRPAMMMAYTILEPILRAHPVVLEPEQMNIIDDRDWSFSEAVDYAAMAHLPFEPVYLDFGGHSPVMVNLKYGPCRLYGAVIWRSGHFQSPALAVAPIGGFDYLVGPFADAMIARGIPEEDVLRYIGARPGKEAQEGQTVPYGSISQQKELGLYHSTGSREWEQWRYQPTGICWLGMDDTKLGAPSLPYQVVEQTIQQERGASQVPMVYSTNQAVAEAVSASTEVVKSVILTGMYDSPDTDQVKPLDDWFHLCEGATEMVAKLTERALLGLYFMENAPIRVQEVELSRPQRRENERAIQKGRSPKPVASIIVINRPRTRGQRQETLGEGRHLEEQHERTGHFRHYHSNNRHYQNRPDLVKPCHRCARRYAENLEAQREGRSIPHEDVESPDCIKQWIDQTVVGPEDALLRKKVRVFKKQKDEEAA